MSSSLHDGTIFAGRYRIVRCIARGGMGEVYEVVHLETERRRALKVMLPHVLQSDELRERFKREARVAAHIESEFIVDVFDAGVDEATEMPFLVMELLRGEELGKRLRRVGRFSPAEAVTYLHQTALALDKTHKASIVHRDLKPDNLFLTERENGPPTIKVLDFGVAKLIADGATNANATSAVGTPLYMSPEQFTSDTRISAASDVYALGMLAYTLLVGKPYWAEDLKRGNVFMFAAIAVHGPQESPIARAAALGVTLPPAFDGWFWKVTAVNPAHRYQPATAAVSALAQVFGMMPLTTGTSLPQVSITGPISAPGSGPAHGPASAHGPLSAHGPAPTPGMSPAPHHPALTPIGASLTKAPQSRRNGALIGVAVTVSVIMLGGGAYLLRSIIARPPIAATGPEEARAATQAAPPSPSPPEPAGPPTLGSSTGPAPGVASTAPQPSAVSSPSESPSKTAGTSAPTSSAKAKAPTVSSPSTARPPSKKPPVKPHYSQD
jgi:serine/threonine-protein kinase